MIRVNAEQPFVILGVDLGVPRSVADTELLRFEIEPEDGGPAVVIEVPAEDARDQIRSTAVVTLAVASASLPPATYALRVSLPSRPRLPALFETRLEIVADTHSREDLRKE